MPYIVPKELPKSCYDCPFSCVLESHPYWSGEKDKKGTKTIYCQVDAERRELTTDFYDKSAKADWCPLVDAAGVVQRAELNVTDFLQMVENLCKYEYSLSYEKIEESIMRQVAARVQKGEQT